MKEEIPVWFIMKKYNYKAYLNKISHSFFQVRALFFLQVMMKSNEGMTLMFKIHWIHCKLQLRYCWLLHVSTQCWFSRILICFLKTNYYKKQYYPIIILIVEYSARLVYTCDFSYMKDVLLASLKFFEEKQ